MKKKRIWVYLPLVLVWGLVAVLSADPGMIITKDISLALTVTDTCVDTMTGTVTAGAVSQKGLRVNGKSFATYLPILAAAGNVYFDTTVTTVGPYAITSVTKTATVFRINATTGHFDQIAGTVHAASDSVQVFLDSGTAPLGKHKIIYGAYMESDSAISATAMATLIARTRVDGDTFFAASWTITVKCWHPTITDYADSVATHIELDTTWGNRSFDSLFMHAQRSHAVTGWTFHGLKRGGHINTKVDTTEWFSVPIADYYAIHLRCIRFHQLDSTIAWTKLQSKMILDNRDNQIVDVCSSAVCTDTTLMPSNWFQYPFLDADGGPDTTIAGGGHFGLAFRFISTVVDSESRPALYGHHTAVRFLNFIKVKY